MNWLDFDHSHIWHPNAGLPNAIEPLPVVSASGARLTLEEGGELIDGTSAGGGAIHGYNHPRINSAIYSQLREMSHISFNGLTHHSAVGLAQRLIEITPASLNKIFFTDSSSAAIEVALKMALQYWSSQGKRQKQRMLALRGSFHGDSAGALSISDPDSVSYRSFAKVLTKHYYADTPKSRPDSDFKPTDIASVERLLDVYSHEIAAVIVEPLVQVAGGMHFYHHEYLQNLQAICERNQVLLIIDEINTGFGRTGKMFACEHADLAPDILCVGNALTAGYMALGVTLCTTAVAQTISNNEPGMILHGEYFSGNPLACTVACENIDLLSTGTWQKQTSAINAQLKQELQPATDVTGVADVRVLGAIGVIELTESLDMHKVRAQLLKRGVWLNPSKNLVVTTPAYTISSGDLSEVTATMCAIAADCMTTVED